MKKVIYAVLVLILSTNVFAYKLPDIKIDKPSKDAKPKIVFFTAKSVVVNEKQSYLLKWKTLNATKVTMTYLGEMKLDGNVTVTAEEFNHGAIVLEATSDKSKYSDSVVLNENKEVFDEANPVPKNSSVRGRQFYDTVPNTHMNPYRRVRPGMYPRAYPRRYR